MRRLLALCAVLLPLALPAAEGASAAKKSQQRVYDGIMSDGDLYAGEGVVSLSSFGGDAAKAKASARERARANLVEGIRVRIVSKTTDTQSHGAAGDKEEIKAESSSSADLELEGIQYKTLEGFPEEGKLTVLASLSKEDYQRQADQRVLAYRPLHALRLWGGVIDNARMNQLEESNTGNPKDAPVLSGPSNNGNNQSIMSFGGDFYWKSFFVGFGASFARSGLYLYRPDLGGYQLNTSAWSNLMVKLGYEWTPWATRLQPVIPVQVEYDFMNWDPNFAQSLAVAGGLRLRYWTSDRVAFDVGGLWHQGLTSSTVSGRGGEAIYYKPGSTLEWNGTGIEATVGVLWNGF